MQTAQQTTQESPIRGKITAIEREIEAAIRGGGKYHGLNEALQTIDEHIEMAHHGFEQMVAIAEMYTDEETTDEVIELLFQKLGKTDDGEVVNEGEYQRMKSYLAERFATALLMVEESEIRFQSDPHPEVSIGNVAPLTELAGEGAVPAVYAVTYDGDTPVSQYEMADVDGLLVCGCPDKVYRYSSGLRRCKHELSAAISHTSCHSV